MTDAELDRSVAKAIGDVEKHYLKHVTNSCEQCSKCGRKFLRISEGEPVGAVKGNCIRPFSTDWNAAMFAAEKSMLLSTDFENGLVLHRPYNDGRSTWTVTKFSQQGPIRYYEDRISEDESGPKAICLAILNLHSSSRSRP